MFDGRSYPKGAWVLHMLRNRLGDDAFFKGIRQYGIDFKFQTVETSDFSRSLERTTGRDLERFFYDWLERPGHPDLDITTTFNAETRQVQLIIKQTQTMDPYHIPVKAVLYCKGIAEPVVLEEEMKERELKLSATLPAALERLEFDPDQAVLATFKETKSRELWKDQLLHGSTVPQRLRAILHFRDSKDVADKQLLLDAYRQEKQHDVKLQLGNAVGNGKLPAGRDALLEGLKSKEALIRHNSLQNLGKYPQDETIVAAVREIMLKGDPSYAVEGTAVRTYAKLGQKDAVALITPWLKKPSHQNTLMSYAVNALGELADPTTIETLIEYTAPGKPRNCRNFAERAIVNMVKNKKLSDEQTKLVLQHFESSLKQEDQMLHFMVLEGLQALGTAGSPALSTVEKLAETLPAGNLKDSATKTLAKLKEKPQADTSAVEAELNKARQQVKELERKLEELKKTSKQ